MSCSAANRVSHDFDDEVEASAQVRPERNLLAAVLSRAILDAFGTAHCDRHIVRDARRWLFSRLKPTRVFSFGWVASHLDLDPVEFQEYLRQYEDNPEEIQDRLVLLR